MPDPHFRPMELGDILDGAFKIYRARALPMFALGLLPYPLALLLGAAAGEQPGPAVTVLSVLVLLLMGAGFLVSWGGVTHLVSETYLGRQATVRDGLREGVRRLPSLTGAMGLTFAAIGTGLVACLVPGLLLALMFFAVIPAVVVEGAGPLRAMRRSHDLSDQAFWPIFLVMLVVWLIAALPGYAVSFATGVLSLGGDPGAGVRLTGDLLRIGFSAVTAPFSMATTVLLYFDRRIRVEAFDVQLAAEALGAEPAV